MAMERRDALKGLMASAGAAWVSTLTELAHAHASGVRAQPSSAWTPKVFTAHQNDTVVTITELIIPQTDTAGAKAAHVNVFIDTILADAHEAARDEFLRGLTWIDDRSRELYRRDFIDCSADEQTAFLTSLDGNPALSERTGVELFDAIKELTVTGYYTSQVGMLEELGDDGGLDFDDDPGCAHPEHQARTGGAQ